MRLPATACVLFLVLFSVPAVRGESGSGQLVVGATVAPHVRWEVRDEPVRLEITAGDIARGFIEVPAARLRVQTNDEAGFIVAATVSGDQFASGALTGLDQSMTIGAGGGFLHSPFRGTAVMEAEMHWRLPLSNRSEAGSYPWPLRITVHPIARQNP
jgi:hypothetical protein